MCIKIRLDTVNDLICWFSNLVQNLQPSNKADVVIPRNIIAGGILWTPLYII